MSWRIRKLILVIVTLILSEGGFLLTPGVSSFNGSLLFVLCFRVRRAVSLPLGVVISGRKRLIMPRRIVPSTGGLRGLRTVVIDCSTLHGGRLICIRRVLLG